MLVAYVLWPKLIDLLAKWLFHPWLYDPLYFKLKSTMWPDCPFQSHLLVICHWTHFQVSDNCHVLLLMWARVPSSWSFLWLLLLTFLCLACPQSLVISQRRIPTVCHYSVGNPRGRIKSPKPSRISNLVIPILMWNVIQHLLTWSLLTSIDWVHNVELLWWFWR